MAKGVTVSIEGLREVDAALGELGKVLGRSVMRRVAVKRLQPMAEDARSLAPDDPNTGGNDLKASISVSTQLGKRQRKLNKRGKSEVEAHMGPAGPGGNVPPQGIQQEFGNQNHGPQPFMRPAFDSGKDALIDGVGEDFWDEISKAAERKAKKTARLAAKG